MLKIMLLEFSSFVIGQNRSGWRNSRLLLVESSIMRMFWKDDVKVDGTYNDLKLEFSGNFFDYIIDL